MSRYVLEKGEHSCEEDTNSLLIHLARQKYKQLSAEIGVTTNEAYRIVLEELQCNHPHLVPYFSSFQSLSSMGHRASKKSTPPIRSSPADQMIPDEYAKTIDGLQHLMYFGVEGEPPVNDETDQRLVIAMFSTVDSFTKCAHATHVCFDGTFKVCPRPFYQLYTIHAYIGDICVPLIHVKQHTLFDYTLINNFTVLAISKIQVNLHVFNQDYTKTCVSFKFTT